ncbi:MAG: NAD(P)H-dependent oxidoreductase, partial [Acutalibacteraceae bacterium]
MKLLHIAASPKSEEQSSGKRVANAFVDAYLKKHEQVQFRYIDLHTLEIPAMTKELLEAFESGKAQCEREQQALQIYDSLCNEFIAADRYVISFPNWNLTAPPVLVSYILAVIRAGKAFRYTEQG